jgi:ribonuclease P protein component
MNAGKGFLVQNRKGETYRRKERIGKQGDIERLFERGLRYHSKQYGLILLENDLDVLRLAVTMRRKIGGSVVRNYEKRVCREFFRKEKHGFPKGFDVLILVKERTLDFHSSYESLKGLFCRGFKSYLTAPRAHAVHAVHET